MAEGLGLRDEVLWASERFEMRVSGMWALGVVGSRGKRRATGVTESTDRMVHCFIWL